MNKFFKKNYTFELTFGHLLSYLLNLSVFQAKCEYLFPKLIIVFKSYILLDDLCMLKSMILSIYVGLVHRENSQKFVGLWYEICLS